MKAQTKALIASAVVLALALSAVSGITYSWFSDTEKADVTVSTAKVDYKVVFKEGEVTGLATLQDNGTGFTLSGIAANATVQLSAEITNNSTVDTVYQVVLVPSYAEPQQGGKVGYTAYDFKNILVQTASGSAVDLLTKKTETGFDEIVIKDWTQVGAETENVGTVDIVITTPTSYGGTPEAPIVSYDTDGIGYTETDNDRKEWNNKAVREGLSFEIMVVAVQGDYPYRTMDMADDNKTASATLPTNKVVAAEEIVSSGSNLNKIQNVVVDFSNVSTYTTEDQKEEQKVDNQKVTVKVDSITTSSTGSGSETEVELTLSLGDDASATTTKKFDAPVVITMTVPGELKDPVIKYNGSGNNGKVLSTTVNDSETKTTTIVFSVDHFSNYTIVDYEGITDSSELATALNAGKTVKLGQDMDMSDETITIQTEVSQLDLNGHTLTVKNIELEPQEGSVAGSVGLRIVDSGNGKLITEPGLSSAAGIYAKDGAFVEMDGVHYLTNGAGFFPKMNATAVIVRNSQIESTGNYGIGTNAGDAKNAGIKIVIENSTISVHTDNGDATGVMINVDGSLTIKDSYISADRQCLVVRAGTAQVSGTTFEYTGGFTGTGFTEGTWKTGNEVSSAAIVVGNMTQNAYAWDASLTLDGCNVAFPEGKTDLKALIVAQDGTNGKNASVTFANECKTIKDAAYTFIKGDSAPVQVTVGDEGISIAKNEEQTEYTMIPARGST